MNQEKRIVMLSSDMRLIIFGLIGAAAGLWAAGRPEEDGPRRFIETAAAFLGSGLFVHALKMVVIPLVFVSVVTALIRLKNTAKMGRIFAATIFYFFITTSFALLGGLLWVHLIRPGAGGAIPMWGSHASAASLITDTNPGTPSLSSLWQGLPPALFQNPVGAMAKGEVLPVIVFALIFGSALVSLQERTASLDRLFLECFDAVMAVVRGILWFLPVGLAALLAELTLHSNPQLLRQLASFIITVVTATACHGLIVLPLLLWLTTRISPFAFFKTMFPALLTAFSTSSSAATMPVTLNCVRSMEARDDVAGFVIPLGATVNMDGTALYEAVAAMFIAFLAGVDLSLGQQIIVFLTAMAASVGAPGIPSAGMVTMIMVLQSVGLPVEAIALLLPIDRFLDAFRTAVNVEGDAVGALIISRLPSLNSPRA